MQEHVQQKEEKGEQPSSSYPEYDYRARKRTEDGRRLDGWIRLCFHCHIFFFFFWFTSRQTEEHSAVAWANQSNHKDSAFAVVIADQVVAYQH